MIKLGQTVRDVVTGFEGIVVCRADYLHGCTRIDVQPVIYKDGKVPDSVSFDEPQLKITKKTLVMRAKKPKQLIKLGQKIVDPVSGFEGVTIGRAVYLNGCARICVIPKHVDGKEYRNGTWFDEPQVKIFKAKRQVKQGSKITGGPPPCKTSRDY